MPYLRVINPYLLPVRRPFVISSTSRVARLQPLQADLRHPFMPNSTGDLKSRRLSNRPSNPHHELSSAASYNNILATVRHLVATIPSVIPSQNTISMRHSVKPLKVKQLCGMLVLHVAIYINFFERQCSESKYIPKSLDKRKREEGRAAVQEK
ncbi:uncharacterized protein BYT42DRAFT_555276 [Radiomyces spectabilis]|uniref:uncharacterized protein n=1 Tax=Radiomyces spectabilis TaxID=64574 RepID=UPI00221F9847|nr:uncharacterized protein BYT42DRAFT_555276 [Radiomyces spectabilis]KAI8391018.1 hypothetical protein BYT42DRAFT_555276 [Radiomyces spectabilis]